MRKTETVVSKDADGNKVVTVIEVGDWEWLEVRHIRDSYLEASDLWMLSDRYTQLTTEQQTELTTYRQELRDITEYATANEGFENLPSEPIWFG